MRDVKDVMWGEVDGELSRGEVVTGEVVGELIASLSDTSVKLRLNYQIFDQISLQTSQINGKYIGNWIKLYLIV